MACPCDRGMAPLLMKNVPPHALTACSPYSCSEEEAPNCPVCLDPVTEEFTSGAWKIDPGRAVQSLEWHDDDSPVMKHTYFCKDCVQKMLAASNEESGVPRHPLTQKPLDLETLERLYNISREPVAADPSTPYPLTPHPDDSETPVAVDRRPLFPWAWNPVDLQTRERLYNIMREPVAVDPSTTYPLAPHPVDSETPVAVDPTTPYPLAPHPVDSETPVAVDPSTPYPLGPDPDDSETPVAVDRRPLFPWAWNPVDLETPERLFNIRRAPLAVDRRPLSAWLSRIEAHAAAHFHGSAVLFSCLAPLLRRAASAMREGSPASRDIATIPVHGSFVPVVRALSYTCWKKGKPLPDRALVQHAQRMEGFYDHANLEDVIETAGNLLARHCKSRLCLLVQSGRIPFSNVTDTVQHMRVGGTGWDLASTSRRLQPLQDGILLVLGMRHPPVERAHVGCMESPNLAGHFLQYWAEGYLTPERVQIQNLLRYNPFVRADVVRRIERLTPQQAAADGMMPRLLRGLLTTAGVESLHRKTRLIERTNSLVSPASRFDLLDCARRMTVPAVDVI